MRVVLPWLDAALLLASLELLTMLSYTRIQDMRKQAADLPRTYSIRQGDTFDGLARKHKVTLQRLLEANPGADPGKLRPGQQINIPVPDRQHIIDTKGFDPETVRQFDPHSYWKNLYWESHIGKWMRPLNAPEGNTATGYHMMNRPTWNDLVKRHPDAFKGRRHEELATDFDLSHKAYAQQIADKVRDYQYANGVQVNPTDYPRFWYMPGNPYGKEADDYMQKVNGVNWQDVVNRIKAVGGRVRDLAFGKSK